MAIGALAKAPGQSHAVGAVGVVLLGKATGVNLRNIGSTTIYTAPASVTGIVSYVTVVLTLATTVTGLPTVKITSNLNDVFPAQLLLGLTVVNRGWIWPTGLGVSKVVQPGQSLDIEVVIGSTTSVYTADVYAYGYET